MKASFKFWVAASGYCLHVQCHRLERLNNTALLCKNYSGSDLINIPSHNGGRQILLVETTKVSLHRIE